MPRIVATDDLGHRAPLAQEPPKKAPPPPPPPSVLRRVVVTGLGLVTPLGNSAEESWAALVAGRSGIAPITHFASAAFATHFAGEVKGFDPTKWIEAREAKHMDPFV